MIISNNHRIHSFTQTQNRNQTMYIKFLKSDEGEKGIHRIKFVETHSNFLIQQNWLEW